MNRNQLLSINIFFVLIVSFSSQVFSQNLVRNWCFEDTVSCPTNAGQVNKTKYWFAPGGGGGSSEFFHKCSNYSTPNMSYPNWTSIPKNAFGSQMPISGNGYVGMGVFTEPYDNYKEYIETRLSQSLNPTINYYVEFWVSLADKSAYAIENMGALFSTDTMSSTSIIMHSNAQVEHIGGILSDTANWVKVSGYFKPDKDGYQFLTIGNFNTNDSTNYQYLGGTGICYYYIENVVVIDSALQHTIGIDTSTPSAVPDIKVYPNPTNSDITIEFKNEPQSIIMVKIVDVVGKVVLEKEYEATQKLLIDINSFKSGIYLITLFTNNEIYETKRIIKY